MQKCIYCGSETKEEWGDDEHGHCGSVFYCKNGCEPFDDFDVEHADTEQANNCFNLTNKRAPWEMKPRGRRGRDG